MPISAHHSQDIFTYPTPLVISAGKGASYTQQITVGDLHGNAMKLMFILVTHQIASMAEEDYNKLVIIYKTSVEELTKLQLDEFNNILSRIKFNPKIPGSEIAQCLTLIGDVVK